MKVIETPIEDVLNRARYFATNVIFLKLLTKKFSTGYWLTSVLFKTIIAQQPKHPSWAALSN